jgi:ketosteroid isomerase-like protein
MSEANVEIVRRVYETFAQRGDPHIRQKAVADLWHEDARFYPLLLGGGALEGAVYEGHEGLLRFYEQADDTWSALTLESVELRDLDQSRVLALVRWSAVGEGSGAGVSAEAWVVFALRDEKIIEARTFAAEANALNYDPQDTGVSD